jgi:hypothetical protein
MKHMNVQFAAAGVNASRWRRAEYRGSGTTHKQWKVLPLTW